MINERDLRSVEVSSWLDFKTEHERFPVWSNEMNYPPARGTKRGKFVKKRTERLLKRERRAHVWEIVLTG